MLKTSLIHPDILRIVAKHYNVSRADLLSQRRTAARFQPGPAGAFRSRSSNVSPSTECVST